MGLKATATILGAGAAIAIGACSTQTPAGQTAGVSRGQCFLPSQVTGFHAVDDDTVHVFVGANDVYTLDLAGPCPNVDWSLQVGIRSTGGSDWVCGGLDAELLVPDVSGQGTNRCMVTNIQQLDPDAARAARTSRGS